MVGKKYSWFFTEASYSYVSYPG